MGNLKGSKKIKINGRYRIPDELARKRGVPALRELKSVKNLDYTRQLRDYMDIANLKGATYTLEVDWPVLDRVSKEIRDLVKSKKITFTGLNGSPIPPWKLKKLGF